MRTGEGSLPPEDLSSLLAVRMVSALVHEADQSPQPTATRPLSLCVFLYLPSRIAREVGDGRHPSTYPTCITNQNASRKSTSRASATPPNSHHFPRAAPVPDVFRVSPDTLRRSIHCPQKIGASFKKNCAVVSPVAGKQTLAAASASCTWAHIDDSVAANDAQVDVVAAL